MVSKLSKEGSFRKGLEVFQALPELGIAPDTAITNSAISACDKGARPAPRRSLPATGQSQYGSGGPTRALDCCIERNGAVACEAVMQSTVLKGAGDMCMHYLWSC